MRHAGGARVGARAAEGLCGDLLVGDRLDDVGAGDKHVGRVLDHHREVRHRRRVHRAARARPHDHRYLRHHARRVHVALEDLGVPGERADALLDARAARVVEADDGRADAHRLVHYLADLLRVRLAEAAAEDGEVLREDEDSAAVDLPVASNDTVTRRAVVGHAEVLAAVRLQHVVLAEAALVEQEVDSLARGELALAVLCLDARAWHLRRDRAGSSCSEMRRKTSCALACVRGPPAAPLPPRRTGCARGAAKGLASEQHHANGAAAVAVDQYE